MKKSITRETDLGKHASVLEKYFAYMIKSFLGIKLYRTLTGSYANI
ncbi:hypothetical protein [Fredinandcohnia onubensis]|nr:hypothetical protein [Fredinandcohnia onubensis]